MTGRHPGGQAFDADELGDADGGELRAALDTGRALDGSIDDVVTRVPADFSARVMAAVANEPTPGAVGFMAPLRRRGVIAGFGASVRQAWATISAPGLPSFARATALAYVLVVAMAGVALAGAATVSVGSALGVFGPAPTSTPATRTNLPPATLAPPTGPSATDDHDTDEPSESPEASDDHGGADETEAPGDDGEGGSSGPGSSHGGSGGDDGGDSGSGGSGSGSGATHTPRPSETPDPDETPEPSDSGD